MKKAAHIFKWWRGQQEIDRINGLLDLKKPQVANLNREIEELENRLSELKKEVFSIRLGAIGKTDPVDEYMENKNV